MMPKHFQVAAQLLEPYFIGRKLRTLRAQKNLTLSRLAADVGLSTALLSKLENDRMVPTLQTLAMICSVFGVGLSFFFIAAAKHSRSITRRAHETGDGRPKAALKETAVSLKQYRENHALYRLMIASVTTAYTNTKACSYIN
jgi:transcriptional regulator with XRE-family HTH domain